MSPVVAEAILLDGRPVIRVKDHGFLVGKGYFANADEVLATLTTDQLARLELR